MKIAVIGASGKAGSLIADELIQRGHDVTGFVLHPEKVKNEKIHVVEKNIFSISGADLRGFDIVISAFGQFTPGLGFQHQTAMMMLIHALEDLPDTRLMVVGGAASLFTDETKEHRALERIPEKFHEVPSNMFDAFKMLQESKINWTYFSPAFTFDPQGERTGKYTLGTDFLFNNEDGESYISYADYAIAMADEAEQGRFVGKRFTAVGRRHKEVAAAQDAADVSEQKAAKTDAPKQDKNDEGGKVFEDVAFEGNSKYRGAPVTELGGKAFDLVLDNGMEGSLVFNSGKTLTWNPIGKPGRTEYYDCLKVDEDTYFVNVEPRNMHPRLGLALVMDLEQSLVTALFSRQEVDEKYPDKVVNEFVFGAIRRPDGTTPKIRHSFTADLVGCRIRWRYSDTFQISHMYYDPYYMRAPLPDPEKEPERYAIFSKNPYDVPCRYVKIKKNIYFVSFIEDFTLTKGRVGSSLTLLMDISRLHDVGRSFGTWAGKWENYLFSAVGAWEEPTEADLDPKSPYRV